MSLAGPAGRAWAALDGAVGRRVSAGRLGERPGRLGLRPGQDRSPAWFQLAAGLPARPPGPPGRHPRQGHGHLTARLCRDRAGYAADAGRRREHRPDARTARTRHRPRPPLMPAARSRDRVRVECDVGPRYRTIAGYRLPRRQGAGSEWTRFPVTPAPLPPATRTWPLYWRDRHLRFHLYDEPGPSPGIGGLLRETGRGPIAIFWG